MLGIRGLDAWITNPTFYGIDARWDSVALVSLRVSPRCMNLTKYRIKLISSEVIDASLSVKTIELQCESVGHVELLDDNDDLARLRIKS